MRKLFYLTFLLTAPLVFGQPTVPNSKPSSTGPAAELSTGDAVILGTVEGVTEYLPVSSTGHLIIATHALHLDSDEALRGSDQRVLWYQSPSTKHPEGIPLTLKLAADTYTVIIQFGAIAAVALLYWRQLLSMLWGLLGRDPAGLILLRNVMLAFMPAAIVGLATHAWIEDHLFSMGTVIAAQVIGALMIFAAERYRKRRDQRAAVPVGNHVLTIPQSINIGLLQCGALWPGMSRSMTTIVGGYFAGLDPRRSAEFSFLLGFVTLTAATIFKGYKTGGAMIEVFGWSHVLLGCAVAAITAALAVKFLVGWLSRHGMIAFAYYRIVFAALLAALTWL